MLPRRQPGGDGRNLVRTVMTGRPPTAQQEGPAAASGGCIMAVRQAQEPTAGRQAGSQPANSQATAPRTAVWGQGHPARPQPRLHLPSAPARAVKTQLGPSGYLENESFCHRQARPCLGGLPPTHRAAARSLPRPLGAPHKNVRRAQQVALATPRGKPVQSRTRSHRLQQGKCTPQCSE